MLSKATRPGRRAFYAFSAGTIEGDETAWVGDSSSVVSLEEKVEAGNQGGGSGAKRFAQRLSMLNGSKDGLESFSEGSVVVSTALHAHI